MSKTTKWIIGIAVVLLLFFLVRGAFASTTHADKVNLCHKTDSETNPWVAQQVNANEVQSHLGNGDFLYFGPLKSNGQPNNEDKQADNWCKNHVPETTPTPTPTATPTATPSATPTTKPFNPATDQEDKCNNNDGKFAGVQTVVPEGATQLPNGTCVDNQTSTATVAAAVTELPATGDNSFFSYLALVLGLIGTGTVASLWANKKLESIKKG